MVRMFEPDEGVCLTVVQQMVSPKQDFYSFLHGFIFYDFYSYGFPFFALSALVVLPLQWFNQITNTALVMLVLRQLISVMPMLIALLILVYMQDGFRTYRSVILLVFMLMIPAILRNAYWWHPDGLVIFLSALILLMLWKDARQFKWRFYVAAVLCGILIATKLVGVYFFLAIGMTLIWGVIEKKISAKKAILLGVFFILIMAVSFLAANPFLLSKWARAGYAFTLNQESSELTQGYGVLYKKGLASAWPAIHQYYGEAILLILTIGITIYGIWKKQERFLYALIFSWFIPLTISLLTVTHFKFQYWLPVAIPMFSNLAIVFPVNISLDEKKPLVLTSNICVLVILLIQIMLFARNDINSIIDRTNRDINNPRIDFYQQALPNFQILLNHPMNVYYDYRLYIPENSGWKYTTNYEMLDYDYINTNQFDVLFILNSRINDYLNPKNIGIDATEMRDARDFYENAKVGLIKGYYLVFKNKTGEIFIRNSVCDQFQKLNCGQSHYAP